MSKVMRTDDIRPHERRVLCETNPVVYHSCEWKEVTEKLLGCLESIAIDHLVKLVGQLRKLRVDLEDVPVLA